MEILTKQKNKMRTKQLLLLIFMMGAFVTANAQRHDEFANFKRYAQANAELGLPAKGEKRVVLMGNSITDGWPGTRPEFFKENPWLVGRGIGGQTSYQFVLRFHQDVIALKPYAVVINYGTNDIALNTGPYDEGRTFNNVCAMVEMARANGIKVVLASCLPAGGFGWRPEVKDAMAKVISLNERVKAYAKANKIPYVDYFSALLSEDGTEMNPVYAKDKPGIHPNVEGYKVMESVLMPVLKKVRK